jgi:hypothetical protein
MGEILAKFFAVAKKDCCNYSASGPNGKTDYCYPGPKSCFLKDDQFCKWFDEAVIAYKTYRDAGLHTQWRELWEGTPNRILNKLCKICGDEFRQTSPRQSFCLKCKKLSQTEAARLRKRREREKGF